VAYDLRTADMRVLMVHETRAGADPSMSGAAKNVSRINLHLASEQIGRPRAGPAA